MSPASTDRPPPIWLRHDLLVVAAAAAILAAGALLYRALTRPEMTEFSRHGLRFDRPANLLPPSTVEDPGSALGALEDEGATDSAARPAGLPFHQVFQSIDDPRSRLEVRIDVRPDYRGLPMALRLARHTRYGEFYWTDLSEPRKVAGYDWQRTRFKYAFKATEDDAPQVATAVEYAALNGTLLYVVTMHGTESGAARLEALIADTLAVDSVGAPAP